MPIFEPGSLYSPTAILHGLADSVAGPYDWHAQPPLNVTPGINPAALFLPDPAGGGTTLSTLWVGGRVLVADSPYGPFRAAEPEWAYPGVNPAPVFKDGVLYMTNQHTQEILVAPVAAGAPLTWSHFANISHAAFPTASYAVEDPRLYIDSRGRFHILNHAMDQAQSSACFESDVSAHFFSLDGREWGFSRQPYGHFVSYSDGSRTGFITLERPAVVLGARGELTHLVLAADAVTGDAGCPDKRGKCIVFFGKCPCNCCKFVDHTLTTIVALGA